MSLALISGSSGLVGSETATFLIKKGFEVIGVDNNERYKLFGKDGDTIRIKNRLIQSSKSYKHLDIDITNKSKIERIFKKYKNKFSFILHAAAQPSHDWAKSNIIKDFNINAVGTLHMLELTRLYSPGAKFIFAGTTMFVPLGIRSKSNVATMSIMSRLKKYANKLSASDVAVTNKEADA